MNLRVKKHITLDPETWVWLQKEVEARGFKGTGTLIDQLVKEYRALTTAGAAHAR